jgi:vitamin B12 transporter
VTASARVALLGLSALAATGLHAAERSTLPPVFVTGSQLPQSEATVSQSVIILPETQVNARAPATLPELLRGVASVHVDQPGAPGGFSSLYLRGADPSHTLILIDGVRITDPTNSRGGGMDLSLIDPRTIARVEILPGASSAIYGADGMAGVLNIITREPRESGLRFGAAAGGRGYRTVYATGALKGDAAAFQAEGAATNDGDGSEHARLRLRTGGVRFNAGSGGDKRLSAWIRLQHHESAAFPDDSGGPVFAVRRQLEQRETNGVIGAVNAERRADWGSLRLYSNAFRQDADIDSPGVAPGVRDPVGLPRTLSASQYRRWTVGGVATFGSDVEAPLLIGAQYEHESGDVASTLFFGSFGVPASFALTRYTRSVFTEGRLKLGERVTAQAGLRADDTSAHGTRTTFQLGMRYRLADTGPSIAINYGTGFKPPSFFALGHPIVGNPALKAEESRTLELSVSSQWSLSAARPLAYRAALFRSQYENLVDFDPGPPPRLVNRSEVEIKGYEVSADARVSDALLLRGAVTGLTFDLPPDTPPLRNRPRFRATSSAAYTVTPQLTASLFGSWVGRVFDSSIPTGAVQLSPYFVLDATLSYTTGGARVVLALDNVLDRDYQQFVGFPARGRRARVELVLQL